MDNSNSAKLIKKASQLLKEAAGNSSTHYIDVNELKKLASKKESEKKDDS